MFTFYRIHSQDRPIGVSTNTDLLFIGTYTISILYIFQYESIVTFIKVKITYIYTHVKPRTLHDGRRFHVVVDTATGVLQ